jgi:hypothetical protein
MTTGERKMYVAPAMAPLEDLIPYVEKRESSPSVATTFTASKPGDRVFLHSMWNVPKPADNLLARAA